MTAAGNLLLDILLPVLGGESLEEVIVQLSGVNVSS